MRFIKFAAWFLLAMAAVMLIMMILAIRAGNPVQSVTAVLYLVSDLMWSRVAWVCSEVM